MFFGHSVSICECQTSTCVDSRVHVHIYVQERHVRIYAQKSLSHATYLMVLSTAAMAFGDTGPSRFHLTVFESEARTTPWFSSTVSSSSPASCAICNIHNSIDDMEGGTLITN